MILWIHQCTELVTWWIHTNQFREAHASKRNCSLRQRLSTIYVCSLLSLLFSSNPTTTTEPTSRKVSKTVTYTDDSTTLKVTTLTFSQPQTAISNITVYFAANRNLNEKMRTKILY